MAWTFDKFLNKFRKKDSIDPSILDAKADLVDGKVPSDQLPSYVDDVLEFANVAGFPATWETGKIYVALDTWYTYRRSGSEYIQIGWQDLPEKATWAEVDTWTDDAKYVTPKAIEDSSYMKNPMTTAWDVIYWWTSWVPTRLAKWTAWQVLKMNSWATAPEWWASSGWGSYLFAVAWTIWATWTNVSATHIANWTQTITSVDLWYGTAWNGTLTVDVNKNGTTIFSTTKPTITSTNQSSVNSWTLTTTSLASWDRLTIDIDWVPATTAPVDLYVRVNYS